MKNNKMKYRILAYSLVLAIILPLIGIGIWSFANRWQWPYLMPTDYGIRGWLYIFNSRVKTLVLNDN